MHIPQTETALLKVLSFEDALELSLLPNENYSVDRWLYVPNFYAEYRYILGTRGKKPLICIGINPSTAVPDALDPTLKSVERIALQNGFDSFIMFNVYAQRATDPNHMEKECNSFLHKQNMKAFSYILSLSDTPCIWAAWGTIIEKRPYLWDCVQDMIQIGKDYGAKWVCAGKCSLKKGHPHHPLYLKKEEAIRDFDIERYIKGLKIE